MISDEELLRKLAGIEGIASHRLGNSPHINNWNPLTNWADCGPLFEKYIRSIDWVPHTKKYLTRTKVNYSLTYERNDPDLKRAICLAVIASEV